MSCVVRETVLSRGTGVRVNGMPIPRALIAREAQNHPSRTPADAWRAAAQSLVIRELLLQEARRLVIPPEPCADGDGRRETDEEAMIRTLIEREVTTPEPDEAVCRRYYDQNWRRFRSPDIFEAAHILFAAPSGDAQAYARAHADATVVLDELRRAPHRFAELARSHSACPSAAHGGNLGQITPRQTTPEFEQALVQMTPGELSAEPVATRYGFHIIRLDRRISGRELPFDMVADRIAVYLKERVERRAIAQYVARLAERTAIEGVALTTADALRVN
jgi:peptidyl-prolyl cis-trans isomerase C